MHTRPIGSPPSLNPLPSLQQRQNPNPTATINQPQPSPIDPTKTHTAHNTSELFLRLAISKQQNISLPQNEYPEELRTKSGTKCSTRKTIDKTAKTVFKELRAQENTTSLNAQSPQIETLLNMIKGHEILRDPSTIKESKNNQTKAERLAKKFTIPGGSYEKFFQGKVLFDQNELGNEPHVMYAKATLNFIYAHLDNDADRTAFKQIKAAFTKDLLSQVTATETVIQPIFSGPPLPPVAVSTQASAKDAVAEALRDTWDTDADTQVWDDHLFQSLTDKHVGVLLTPPNAEAGLFDINHAHSHPDNWAGTPFRAPHREVREEAGLFDSIYPPHADRIPSSDRADTPLSETDTENSKELDTIEYIRPDNSHATRVPRETPYGTPLFDDISAEEDDLFVSLDEAPARNPDTKDKVDTPILNAVFKRKRTSQRKMPRQPQAPCVQDI